MVCVHVYEGKFLTFVWPDVFPDTLKSVKVVEKNVLDLAVEKVAHKIVCLAITEDISYWKAEWKGSLAS
jgi:hypothetical protein